MIAPFYGQRSNANMDNTRAQIRFTILEMEKPFCISDLFFRLEKDGFKDRELILQVLDELYDEGLVNYCKMNGIVDNPDSSSGWAFQVA